MPFLRELISRARKRKKEKKKGRKKGKGEMTVILLDPRSSEDLSEGRIASILSCFKKRGEYLGKRHS